MRRSPERAQVAQQKNKIKACRIPSEDSCFSQRSRLYYLADYLSVQYLTWSKVHLGIK